MLTMKGGFFLLLLVFLSTLGMVFCNANSITSATALYYLDEHGNVVLITGKIPPEAERAIAKDITKRYDNAPKNIPISPIYEDVKKLPVFNDQNVLSVLKNTYPDVYILNLKPKISRALAIHMKRDSNFKFNVVKSELKHEHKELVKPFESSHVEWGYIYPKQIVYAVGMKRENKTPARKVMRLPQLFNWFSLI